MHERLDRLRASARRIYQEELRALILFVVLIVLAVVLFVQLNNPYALLYGFVSWLGGCVYYHLFLVAKAE